MQHAILRSRPSKAYWFRVCWNKIEYACREGNGSLRPVPPGTTRKKLYCGQCTAAKCLLTGKRRKSAVAKAEEQELARTKYQQDKARKRAQGLNTGSKPLQRICWNCCQMRIKLGGYVCRHEPEAEPASRGKMTHRYAEDCQGFGWRLEVAIPPLDGDGADCGPL